MRKKHENRKEKKRRRKTSLHVSTMRRCFKRAMGRQKSPLLIKALSLVRGQKSESLKPRFFLRVSNALCISWQSTNGGWKLESHELLYELWMKIRNYQLFWGQQKCTWVLTHSHMMAFWQPKWRNNFRTTAVYKDMLCAMWPVGGIYCSLVI